MKINIPKKIKMGLKIFGVCMGIGLLLNNVDASISKNLPKSTISDTFPETYQSYIDNLKETYPNATFKAVYTGLDWDLVLKHECYEVKEGISLIPSSYPDTWKKDGKNIYKDGYFVVASKSAVAYTIDPRNSLYPKYVFQFEGLTYNENITIPVIEKVIAGSPLVGTYAKKYKNAGQWVDMDKSYSDIIDEVGKKLGVSSVYIASRMIQETSGDIINNGSVNGSNSTYPGVYNFFNIGSTPNKDGTGAVLNGLKYAKKAGWTTPYLSIYGGVDEIKSSYIKYGQDTVYFQKFDVNNPYGNASALMMYQYQTNIMAPTSESIISYGAYKKLNMLDTAFTFYVPVYNNMPEDPAPYPAGDNAKFVEDNTKVYLDDEIENGTDVFNIRSSASSELDNIIYKIEEAKEGADNRLVMTRTKKGEGYDYDYVEIIDGENIIKGYVWNEYVKVYDYTKVENIFLDKTEATLEIGDTLNLNYSITPDDAKFKEVIWSSQDESIVSVKDGVLTANKAGSTKIVVTTQDGNKTAECAVTVVEKTYDITLDKEEYTIVVNESVTPVITLKNIENYELKITDETIATIKDGAICGISVGETTLEVVGTGTDVKKVVKVQVIEANEQPGQPEEIEISYKFNEKLNVNESIITNVEPNTLVSNFKTNIELLNLTMLIRDLNAKELIDESFIGTGTEIELFKQDNTSYAKFKVLILGEVTGDGIINSGDLFKTVRFLKGNDTIDEKAADVTGDGIINSGDLFKTVRFLKGNDTIDFK